MLQIILIGTLGNRFARCSAAQRVNRLLRSQSVCELQSKLRAILDQTLDFYELVPSVHLKQPNNGSTTGVTCICSATTYSRHAHRPKRTGGDRTKHADSAPALATPPPKLGQPIRRSSPRLRFCAHLTRRSWKRV